MSSTNRSNKRYNHDNDFYVTPVDKIEMFLENFSFDECVFDFFKNDMKILDPCAGGRNDIDDKFYNHMPYVEALKKYIDYFADIETIDLRQNSLAKIKEDYLKMNFNKKFDLIISNPPFFLAEEFIKKSIENINENGYVVMLLRLNFLGGKCRQDFWKKYNPYAIYIHNKRISFTKDRKTDSIEYAHFVWTKSNLKNNNFKTKIMFEY